jgi:hypothetical protein
MPGRPETLDSPFGFAGILTKSSGGLASTIPESPGTRRDMSVAAARKILRSSKSEDSDRIRTLIPIESER